MQIPHWVSQRAHGSRVPSKKIHTEQKITGELRNSSQACGHQLGQIPNSASKITTKLVTATRQNPARLAPASMRC